MGSSDRKGEAGAGLTRREFIAVTAGAAAGSLPLAASTTGAGAEESAVRGQYDVIVIGGGFCGITAARECRRAGLRALVLEARNRLGGRTFTADFGGQTVDLGGSWVHWSQPHVWTEVRRSGLPLAESLGAAADRLILHTSRHDVVTLSYARSGVQLDRAVAAYIGDGRSALPLPFDPFGSDSYHKLDGITSAERLAGLKGLTALDRDYVDGYFASQGHNYSDQFAWLEMVRWYCLSGHNLADMSDMSGRFHFRDGTAALLNFILAEGKPEVRLATPVRRVSEAAAGVTVITARGEELAARLVVSTVPLNVLKDIEWQPALPEAKLAASRETHAGHGTKLHVLVEGDYGNLGGLAPSHNAINSLMTERVVAGNTHLIGFGPDPELLDVNDTDSVQQAVRLFLPDAKVKRSLGYQWTLDPYSQGTWCSLRPHMWSRYLRELQQPTARVIFASADWANGFRGFIDGAIEQGMEAGRRVREVLT
ncbi:MAG: FAD-dependent oxidoreductase [Gammaproteobacteria bacterium]|nr:FAD-dependent oxidoreductase [Gammaproteobacteria bacterium]